MEAGTNRMPFVHHLSAPLGQQSTAIDA